MIADFEDMIFTQRIKELLTTLQGLDDTYQASVARAAQKVADSFVAGGQLLICGNGGSAADSQHLAAEFVSSFSSSIKRRALPALALSVDTSVLTAFSNDFGFDEVFSRQVEAFGKVGDVLIAITTSGSSRNCIAAVKMAKRKKMTVIALTRMHSEIAKFSDISIEVPSENTQHIQECHIFTYHVLCEMVEEELFVAEQSKREQ